MSFMSGSRAHGEARYDTGFPLTRGPLPSCRGRTRVFLLSDAARPLRFAFSGATCARVRH